MGLRLISEHLNGIILFEPIVFGDERGFFMESYRASEFEEMGLPTDFVQDNHSRSQSGVLRGMHFQWDSPQGKLLRVTRGSAYVVEVDIRPDSPTLGKWHGFEINEENKYILWVPPGFANGFCSLADSTEMQYKCTAVWNPDGESNILWNDPDLGIKWPLNSPIVSERDAKAQTFKQWLTRPEAASFSF